MNTKKDLTNISYNTPLFLQETLERLHDEGKIEFWYFIEHLPEMDPDREANKKKHIHLFLRPAKMIQTMNLQKEFNELDPKNPKNPLTVTADWHYCQKGHFGDAFLYDLHDPQYLKHKGITRQYSYTINDIVCSDQNTLERMVSFIDLGQMYRLENIFAAAEMGISYKQAMARGIFGDNPYRYANMYRAILEDHYRELENTRYGLDKKKE